MSYLRFSPREYQAIRDLCQGLNFNRYRPTPLRHFLARSLADSFPELAERIRRLRKQEMDVLHAHMRERGQSGERHGLNDGEFSLVAATCGPLLARTRFLRALKPLLIGHLRDDHPELSAKLAGMGQVRFELLCEQIKLWVLGTS